MKNPTLRFSAPFVFARLFIFLVLTGAISRPASAQTPPTNFRVDVSYGTTGQLFVSWDQEGTDTYILQRSASGGSWSTVGCGPNNLASDSTPFGTQVCRDDNGGQGLTGQVIYTYQVAACTSPTNCSSFTQPYWSMPEGSDCTNTGTNPQIPNLTGFKPPPTYLFRRVASDVTNNAQYGRDAHEFAACANATPATQQHQHILLVDLPGSQGTCSYSALMYTAQNLGFDAICVNYDNYTQQETICLASRTQDPAHCFGNISQTKLDYTGDCILNGPNWTAYNCGTDASKTGQLIPYYVMSYWDAVIPRITSMLQYLCDSPATYNQGSTTWSEYLTSPNTCTGSPVWSKIIMGGFSQGGDMATFAAYENTISRVINKSAPPQAALVNNTMTAAAYFTNTPATNIRKIFGLVSTNDTHYSQTPGSPPTSVFQAVWQALGYNLPANNDRELHLSPSNLEVWFGGLSCNGTPSHNFSNSAAVNHGGSGHDDPNYIWNEDIYTFMLLDIN